MQIFTGYNRLHSPLNNSISLFQVCLWDFTCDNGYQGIMQYYKYRTGCWGDALKISKIKMNTFPRLSLNYTQNFAILQWLKFYLYGLCKIWFTSQQKTVHKVLFIHNILLTKGNGALRW